MLLFLLGVNRRKRWKNKTKVTAKRKSGKKARRAKNKAKQ